MRQILASLLIGSTMVVGGEFMVVDAKQPIVIAHRGASGYRPEHTLGAYELAMEQGADYVEPDLVITKDGHFVARHDVYLSSTTDVAEHPEFADRRKTVKGKTDWFVFDFTLAELKTLRAIQPRKSRGTDFDGQEQVPTLSEIIEIVKGRKVADQQIGLHIELKRPDLFAGTVAELDAKLIEQLNMVHEAGIPLFFQCFDPDFASKVAEQTEFPVVLLVDGKKDAASGWYVPALKVEDYIDKVEGFGLYKALLLNKDRSSSGLMEKLHSAGKEVHIWTLRDDQVAKGFDSIEEELSLYYRLGVDGIFADFPDTALRVRGETKR